MKATSLLYQGYLFQQNDYENIVPPPKITFEEIADLERNVRNKLQSFSAEALKLFDEYQEKHSLHVCNLEEKAYSMGFRTGFQLALETSED